MVALIEEYVTSKASLQNQGNGYHVYSWTSPKNYAGTCKTLKIDLGEGTGQEHIALFQFK